MVEYPKGKHKINDDDLIRWIEKTNFIISNIDKRLEKLENVNPSQRKKTSRYNSKMAFTMPRQVSEDERKVIAILDLPNIINTALNEKAENGEEDTNFFDPEYVKVLLDKYVYIYPHVEKIWIYTTPDYDKINEYLRTINNRTEVVVVAKYDADNKKWLDTDSPIIGHLSSLYDDLSVNNREVSRILLFSGDGDYYDAIANIIQKKKIPCYIICNENGYSSLWTQLRSLNHPEALKSTGGEFLFTYRWYHNKEVEEEM